MRRLLHLSGVDAAGIAGSSIATAVPLAGSTISDFCGTIKVIGTGTVLVGGGHRLPAEFREGSAYSKSCKLRPPARNADVKQTELVVIAEPLRGATCSPAAVLVRILLLNEAAWFLEVVAVCEFRLHRTPTAMARLTEAHLEGNLRANINSTSQAFALSQMPGTLTLTS